MKKGFTLLEIVFVIVITALIATFGINMFFDLYANYLRSRAINMLNSEVDNALDQISSRLSYRVRGATIGRISTTNNSFTDIYSVTGQYQILEWLGSSISARRISGVNPGWSGLVDVNATQTLQKGSTHFSYFVTPGSNLIQAKNILSELYPGGVDHLAVIFKGITSGNPNLSGEYGYDGVNARAVFISHIGASNNRIFVNPGGYTPGQQFNDRYDLADTAYALVPGSTITKPDIVPYYTLNLYYNFQPWMHQTYKNGKSSVIAEYVTQFRFTTLNSKDLLSRSSNAILLKLCAIDGGRSLGNTPITGDKRLQQIANTEICKSRVVF